MIRYFLIAFLMVSPLPAQEFEVKVDYVDLLVIATSTLKVDRMVKGVVLSSEIQEGETTTTKKLTALIEVSLPESIAFCDSAAIIQVGSNYLIDTPGKHKITVVVVDPKLAFKTVLVELGQGPNPPPKPVDPVTPVDPDKKVPNNYGVGQVAFDNAPADPKGLKQFATWYKEAGQYLYGTNGTIKVIANASEPNSVFGWMAEVMDAYPCPNPEICAQWKSWREKVNQAFIASQKARQYTRDDWFAAFNEVATALEIK